MILRACDDLVCICGALFCASEVRQDRRIQRCNLYCLYKPVIYHPCYQIRLLGRRNKWYPLSPIMSLQVGLLESTVVAAFPGTREFPIKYGSIAMSEFESNRTNLAFRLCIFMCLTRSEGLPTTTPQMLHGWATFFCHDITTVRNKFK